MNALSHTIDHSGRKELYDCAPRAPGRRADRRDRRDRSTHRPRAGADRTDGRPRRLDRHVRRRVVRSLILRTDPRPRRGRRGRRVPGGGRQGVPPRQHTVAGAVHQDDPGSPRSPGHRGRLERRRPALQRPGAGLAAHSLPPRLHRRGRPPRHHLRNQRHGVLALREHQSGATHHHGDTRRPDDEARRLEGSPGRLHRQPARTSTAPTTPPTYVWRNTAACSPDWWATAPAGTPGTTPAAPKQPRSCGIYTAWLAARGPRSFR